MNTLAWNEENLHQISEHLIKGGVAVIPTDTIYGLVAKAGDEKAVGCVYELKSRNPEKKCIVLISSLKDLELFGVVLTEKQNETLKLYWPGKFSVELACSSEKFSYLLRGTDSLSFRYPDDKVLCDLLAKTGPLIAPSANPEGLEPATNAEEANSYFGQSKALLVDGGQRNSTPSTLISLLSDSIVVLRG